MKKSNLKKVKLEYDNLSFKYDSYWENYLVKTFDIAFKLGNIKKNEIILDVSGGTGLFASSILDKIGENTKITIVDVSLGMLNVARKRLSNKKNVRIINNDVHKLPFKNNEFSKVFSISAFHYYYNPNKALSEMKRVLKKEGELILIDWCNDLFYFKIFDFFMKIFSKAHHKTFTSKQFIFLLKNNNFKIEKIIKFKVGWWTMMGFKVKNSF